MKSRTHSGMAATTAIRFISCAFVPLEWIEQKLSTGCDRVLRVSGTSERDEKVATQKTPS